MRTGRATRAAAMLLTAAGLSLAAAPAAVAAEPGDTPALPCPTVSVSYGPFSVPAAVRETVSATLRQQGRRYAPTVESADLSIYYLPISGAGDDATVDETLAGVPRVRVLSDRPAARRSLADRLREMTPPCDRLTASAAPAPVAPPPAASTPAAAPASPAPPASTEQPARAAAAPSAGTPPSSSEPAPAAPSAEGRSWGPLLGLAAAAAVALAWVGGLAAGRRRVRELRVGGTPPSAPGGP